MAKYKRIVKLLVTKIMKSNYWNSFVLSQGYSTLVYFCTKMWYGAI